MVAGLVKAISVHKQARSPRTRGVPLREQLIRLAKHAKVKLLLRLGFNQT